MKKIIILSDLSKKLPQALRSLASFKNSELEYADHLLIPSFCKESLISYLVSSKEAVVVTSNKKIVKLLQQRYSTTVVKFILLPGEITASQIIKYFQNNRAVVQHFLNSNVQLLEITYDQQIVVNSTVSYLLKVA